MNKNAQKPLMRRSAAIASLTTAAVFAIPASPTHAFVQASESPREAATPTSDTTPPERVAPSTGAPQAPIDEVVVTGEQPGPSLWKVTHGGTNVAWVLGTVGGIPKGMKWRSRQVEDVIARAQTVIFGENVSPNVGLFRGLLLLPAVLKARFNPDKAELKDIIPREQYERWLVLRKKYLEEDDDIERVRPMFIAMQLNDSVMREAGLNRSGIARIVAQAAKKYKVPMQLAEVKFDLPDPKKAIRDFSGTPRENDLACFNTTLDNLESDLEKMKSRATAWAVGDVEAFRKLPAPVTDKVCQDALTSAPALQGEFTKLKDRVAETWLWDVEKALELNAVTLVVIPLDDVLSPAGRLARLRERGYTIEAP